MDLSKKEIVLSLSETQIMSLTHRQAQSALKTLVLTHEDDKLLFNEINSKLDSITNEIEKYSMNITKLNQDICKASSSSIIQSIPASRPVNPNVLILTGVPEQQNYNSIERIEADLNKVQQICYDLIGNSCNFKDVYRRGKYRNDNKNPRPLVIEVTNDWDRRKLFASCNKLSGTGMFLRHDISIEDHKIEKQLLKYSSLVSMMTEGPIIAIELMGSDAIKKWRDMIGPTDAMEARTQKPESLRGRFAEDNTRNACHGSDSEDSAAREIRFFFPRDSRHRMTTSTMNDVTCCVVKPHGTQFLSEIIREIEQRGFKINAIKSFLLTRAEAEEFFEVYKGVVTEYIDMVTDLCTGMIVAMEIAADGDPQKFRSVVGPADPEICKHVRPDTLRAKFGKTKVKNALHVTDLPGDAPLEVEYFFRILAQ